MHERERRLVEWIRGEEACSIADKCERGREECERRRVRGEVVDERGGGL